MLAASTSLVLTVSVALAAPQGEIPIRSVLAVESIGGGTRSPVFIDRIERARGRGAFRAPSEGEEVTLGNGDKRAWKRVDAGEDGAMAVRGGYAFASVEAPEAGVYLLDALGHRHVIVNGEPRIGDVYGLGFLRVPVALAKGRNDLLFKGGQGRLKATLVPPAAEVVIEERETTLPDLVAGDAGPFPAGLTLLNATAEWRRGATLEAAVAGGAPTRASVPDLPPLSVRRVAFEIAAPGSFAADAKEAVARFTLRDAGGREVHSLETKLAVRSAAEPHRRTFVSGIDGSVQYFAVVPAKDGGEPGKKPALVLTLHGAGVQASGQAACYAPREGVTFVAPTNRRVFGFDWEDWGRIDAMEALARAEALFGTDPRRAYLTGHSMGGHGTWSIGAAAPGRFAAIAPSAGWSDFWSYTGAQALPDTDPVPAMLSRAANSSRTRLLDRNFARAGVYVLHGDADETVPVREARAMRARLAEFHADFAYYERPGAGHWWGNECVDWPPLVEFLVARERPAPASVTSVAFTSVNPAITSSCDWVTLWAQDRSLEPSRVEAKIDPAAGKIEVKTENAAEIVLDLGAWKEGPESREIALDGATLRCAPNADASIRLERGPDGAWRQIDASRLSWKGAHRAGPFKDAFRNRMVFVYGTRGSAEENAWAFAKARYDAETFYYRGNGAAEIVPDTAFDAAADLERNVILFGNADTNAAWPAVLDSSPVEVRRGEVRVGERRLTGPDLACFFIRPRKGSDTASVGAVAATGIFGCRLTDQFPYFTSGIAYPDWTVIGADMLDVGVAGVRGAGFFARDWSLSPAQSAWR